MIKGLFTTRKKKSTGSFRKKNLANRYTTLPFISASSNCAGAFHYNIARNTAITIADSTKNCPTN